MLTLLVGYVWAYMDMVQVIPPPTPRVRNGVRWGAGGVLSGPLMFPTKVPGVAAYRRGGGWVAFVFRPANALDRRIRDDLWSFYDVNLGLYADQKDNPYLRVLHDAVALARPDLEQRCKELQQLISERDVFKVGVPQWTAAQSRLAASAAALREEMAKPAPRSATASSL